MANRSEDFGGGGGAFGGHVPRPEPRLTQTALEKAQRLQSQIASVTDEVAVETIARMTALRDYLIEVDQVPNMPACEKENFARLAKEITAKLTTIEQVRMRGGGK